jgi:hypothetical protein
MQILEGLKLAKKIYKNEIEIFIGTKTIFNPNIKHPKRLISQASRIQVSCF